jgi:hypothetical protein
MQCATPSAFGSVTHASHATGKALACSGGRSPQAWADPSTEWPPGLVRSGPNATQFHAIFTGSRFTGKSLLDVLTDVDPLGKFIVAAFLNARQGLTTPALTETVALNMWGEYSDRGFFEPTATVQWSAAEIVTYIQSTIV